MSDPHREFFERFLAGNKAEALEWLRAGSETSLRNLGEMDPGESTEFVEKLYDLGAQEVLAVEIDEYDDGANSGHVLVRLPADANAREKLFAFESEHAQFAGFEGVPDEGQEYLYLMLD